MDNRTTVDMALPVLHPTEAVVWVGTANKNAPLHTQQKNTADGIPSAVFFSINTPGYVPGTSSKETAPCCIIPAADGQCG